MKRELYWFQQGATSYYYSSADRSYTYLGNEYVFTSIRRTDIESKSETAKSTIDVVFSITHPVARAWANTRLEEIVSLTIFEIDDADVSTIFKGKLASGSPVNNEIVLKFETLYVSQRRPGLRQRMLRACRHSLYGDLCGVDMEAFAFEATPTDVSGVLITIPDAADFDDGYFKGGILKSSDGVLRFIMEHVGAEVTILRPIDGMGLDPLTLYPGCDRTRQTCNDKFNNLPRNGGFEFIPTRNPFDGSSIV